MPRSHRIVLCALPLLATAACGSDGPANTPPSGFPVTIERSGGLAGFGDHVVVAADGSVTATSKGGSAACTVDDDVLAALGRLASSATGSPSSTSQGADALTVVLTSSKGTLALDAGSLPSAAPEVGKLLDDLGRQPSGREVCH